LAADLARRTGASSHPAGLPRLGSGARDCSIRARTRRTRPRARALSSPQPASSRQALETVGVSVVHWKSAIRLLEPARSVQRALPSGGAAAVSRRRRRPANGRQPPLSPPAIQRHPCLWSNARPVAPGFGAGLFCTTWPKPARTWGCVGPTPPKIDWTQGEPPTSVGTARVSAGQPPRLAQLSSTREWHWISDAAIPQAARVGYRRQRVWPLVGVYGCFGFSWFGPSDFFGVSSFVVWIWRLPHGLAWASWPWLEPIAKPPRAQSLAAASERHEGSAGRAWRSPGWACRCTGNAARRSRAHRQGGVPLPASPSSGLRRWPSHHSTQSSLAWFPSVNVIG